MRKIRPQFARKLVTHRGEVFNAELGSPNGYARPRREIQNLPHLAMVVSKHAAAREGDLASTMDGTEKYLLLGQHTLTHTRRFLAVQCNETFRWMREGETIDAVAMVPRNTRPHEMDPALPVVFEHARSFEEANLNREQYRVLTHADVKQGDNLGPYEVTSRAELFGLVLLEVA